MQTQTLKRTPLHAAHAALGGRFVAFAGYELPLQYRDGIIAEHRWTRMHAGLFDISHMGAATLALIRSSGDARADHLAIAAAVEALVPGSLRSLEHGRQCYSLLLNPDGGVIDDLIVGRIGPPGVLHLVVNAATKARDFALLKRALAGLATVAPFTEHAFLALQGPEAADVLGLILQPVLSLRFMEAAWLPFGRDWILVSRSGYTGEDGFELLLPAAIACAVWDQLLQDERVRPIGLGARDSLRLEAGLPLYGHDLDESVSPVEAGLTFVLSRRRLEAGNFPGAQRLRTELRQGPSRLRVGLIVHGAPAREGAQVLSAGQIVGRVTSGGFSPTLSAPIALAFVPPILAKPGTELAVIVRDRPQPATVVPVPFVPRRYVRKA
jgi:aminomethyltransferase